MNKKKVKWFRFVSGESELECESIEDAKTLLRVCVEHDVDCNYVKPDDWIFERYWYVKDNSLETTAYQLEAMIFVIVGQLKIILKIIHIMNRIRWLE